MITRKIRALIADDEKYARSDLKELLSFIPEIEVVGEANNLSTAIKEIELLKPDLIFLDIQFPGESGFELFERTQISARVIFVTAYDEYAIRAFDVNACDYLLKPVNPERLALSVKRILASSQQTVPSSIALNENDSVYIQINYKYYFVRVNSIIKISAKDQYTEIVTSKGLTGLTNRHLWEWEQQLPKNLFVRIHRSTLVNMEYVEKIERNSDYSLLLYLKITGQQLPISRRYAAQIKQRIGLAEKSN